MSAWATKRQGVGAWIEVTLPSTSVIKRWAWYGSVIFSLLFAYARLRMRQRFYRGESNKKVNVIFKCVPCTSVDGRQN